MRAHIKGKNIVINETSSGTPSTKYEARITDFSFTRPVNDSIKRVTQCCPESSSCHGIKMGTPYYMDSHISESLFGKFNDIYSFGETILQDLHKFKHIIYRLLNISEIDISEEIKPIITKLLPINIFVKINAKKIY